MTAIMVAQAEVQHNRSRQLLAFLADGQRKRLERRAKLLMDTAIDYDKRTTMLVNYLYALKTPEGLQEAERLTGEVAKRLRAAGDATRRYLAYVEQHPIESY